MLCCKHCPFLRRLVFVPHCAAFISYATWPCCVHFVHNKNRLKTRWLYLIINPVPLKYIFLSPSSIDVPPMRSKPYYSVVRREQDSGETLYCTKESFLQARVVFIRWLVSFWLEPRPNTHTHIPGTEGENVPKNIQVSMSTLLCITWFLCFNCSICRSKCERF